MRQELKNHTATKVKCRVCVCIVSIFLFGCDGALLHVEVLKMIRLSRTNVDKDAADDGEDLDGGLGHLPIESHKLLKDICQGHQS